MTGLRGRAPPGTERRRAWRRGRAAEALAVWLLRLKGYRILARGLRLEVGEIDILARRGRTLVAVEVKRRSELAEAAEAVRPRQRRRIVRALAAYAARDRRLAGLGLRFDVVLLAAGGWPRHLPDAWREEG
ncbi:MAG: YraN family protein [Dongiaceae bacterium]